MPEFAPETCLEYFHRRLKEGWRCIKLEGHNATLLSPDGVKRELDLRNDVETLRPNAVGAETNIARQWPEENYHYDKVNEVVADDDDTFLYGGVAPASTSYERDLYGLPNHTAVGDINKVTVHFRARGTSEYVAYGKAAIKTHNTVYEGGIETLGGTYWSRSHTWLKNPYTVSDWTWDEIDALQAGVSIRASNANGGAVCTQVYVVVDYTPFPFPTFYSGSAHAATAPIIVLPSGLSCEVELFLGPDDLTKVATSGLVPFVSTGASQDVYLPIIMPVSEGTYHVYIDVYVEGLLIAAYQAIDDVSIIP